MPSPFPGMDPYLERHWLDIHTVFISDARRVLNRNLPVGLVARVEERVAIESPDGDILRVGPDVRVFAPASADLEGAASDLLIEAPYKLVVDLDPVIERFIRILDESGELVTVVELLSPSNKRAPGLADFREKRQQLIRAGVHVVEIDLVRAGDWRSLMRPQIAPPEASAATYRATVRTAVPRPAAYFFPISLRSPLPDIPIPLRRNDVPIKLPLQQLLDGVYDDGRYSVTIDYTGALDPPLDSDNAVWAEQLVKTVRR